MLALKPDETIVLEQGIVLHSLPDQNFYHAFSVVTGDQFQLNRTSFWVLETISNSIEWSHLKNKFLAAFEVTDLQGEADLRKLVSDLYEQKIIRRCNDEK
ncbi:MAG: hypothetical protein D4R38_00010 [Dehalococcoidia bacterium]|nr:MAG: hypothetical protein D4R38_00010 [Dehalococcoidia bacterium]